MNQRKLIVLNKSKSEVCDIMAELSVKLQRVGKVLYIDTINRLNPHHEVYRVKNQKQIFKKIYCVRTPKPYDLLQRLKFTDGFIKRNKIKVMFINSLSCVFEDADENEVNPILKQIIRILEKLTIDNDLITMVGNSEKNVVTVKQASATIRAYSS